MARSRRGIAAIAIAGCTLLVSVSHAFVPTGASLGIAPSPMSKTSAIPSAVLSPVAFTTRTGQSEGSVPSFTAADAVGAGFAIGLAAIGSGVGSRIRRSAAGSLVLSPDETYAAVVGVGESRLVQTTKKVLRDGIVTGCYIGFGGILCSTVGGCATSLQPGLQRFLFGAVGFPLSIFLTTIAGGQGFTPNVGVMMSAFIRKGKFSGRTLSDFGESLKCLAIAYGGNTIGLLTMAYLANLAALPAVPASIEIAHHKVSLTWMQVFVRGILGGWLIGLAVWTSVAAKDVASKFITIWLCIGTYVMCQYEHCLANLFFVPCAIFAGAKIPWATFITANLIPSTLGNMIGGGVMLAGTKRLALGSKPKGVAPALPKAPDADAPLPP